MKWVVPLLVLAACKKQQQTEPPAPEPAPEPVVEPEPAPEPAPSADPPTDEQLAPIARQLSVRDPDPDCATVEASMTTDPLATWLAVIDKVSQPAYAPMRAAGCVISLHAETAKDTLVAWVSDESKQGLGRLVIANLDKLPEGVATEVRAAAAEGPLAGEL